MKVLLIFVGILAFGQEVVKPEAKQGKITPEIRAKIFEKYAEAREAESVILRSERIFREASEELQRLFQECKCQLSTIQGKTMIVPIVDPPKPTEEKKK